MMGQDETAASGITAAPDVTETLPAPQVEKAETPETILANLSNTLKTSEGVDADLAAILTDHLLTGTPHANAVATAKAAIGALAAKRAAPAQDNANG